MKIKLNDGNELIAKTLRAALPSELSAVPSDHPFRDGIWLRPLLDWRSITLCRAVNADSRFGFVHTPFVECNGSFLIHSSMIHFIR